MQQTKDRTYFRPVPCAPSFPGARALADGWTGFAQVEVLTRGAPSQVVPVDAVEVLFPESRPVLAQMQAPRAALAGAVPSCPLLMGVVNVTPDSFSDGGTLAGPDAAVDHGLKLVSDGADFLDIGGESTRPGALPVPDTQESDRVIPVIRGLLKAGCKVPVSIDTRKAAVARAAMEAGARIFNDVSALSYDADSLDAAAQADAVCLMHAQGDPRTMQQDPCYDDVLLDVYDYLKERVSAAEAAGITRSQIVVDPGIGFGKTLQHNLALLRGLSLFHGLGCLVMLGVSRKGFIGKLSGEQVADQRTPGSIAAGLAGLAQGVQILRVHDVAEHAQAIAVWQAVQTDTGKTQG